MKQYSFYSVDLVIDGLPIEGFPDTNSIISAERAVPQHTKVMDARGKMTGVTSADKSGTVTFDLLQNSDSNQWLQARALQSQDAGTSGNAELFVPIQLIMNDKMGQTVVTGVNGMLSMQPAVVRGTNLNVNRWVLEFEQLWMLRGQSPNIGL